MSRKKIILGILVFISIAITSLVIGNRNLKESKDTASISDDMLNALEAYPSLDSYWNDSLILLNQFNKNVRLYGINVNEETAMLLYIEGEKILIEEDPFPSFHNLYQEIPKLNVCDVDSDGVDEVLISLRTVTGTISRYAMLVCDCEDEWNVYMYSDYLDDIEDEIKYQYDDKNNLIAFLDNNGNVLWEGKLPEWTNEYAYTGVVNFGDMMEFDAETFQMNIVPQIALENSLPYEPIRITFDLGFTDGHFKIVSYEIDSCGMAEEIVEEEDIAELGLPEDMLAYWMVFNSKKTFISTDEGYQEFYWDEYYWRLGEIRGRRQADCFMIVDLNGDGANEIVLECSPESTQVLHYEDGIVYSYQFVFRGMKRIHKNGIYEGSDGAASTFYYRLTELNKDGYTEEMLAGMDGDYYEVGGEEAAYEDFCEYVDPIENVELAECIEFTESMLDQHLLGNLSEREITLVKMLPTEKTIENGIDYQEHKQALQLYAAVLTGEQDVIFVTEDTFKYADETLPIYFSLADMDGDGVPELVFSCDYDVVWILHYEQGEVYGYHLRPAPVITTDGVFRTDDDLSPTGYARIAAFEEDGCQIEPVKDYERGSQDRIRYYFFSEESIAQWLE